MLKNFYLTLFFFIFFYLGLYPNIIYAQEKEIQNKIKLYLTGRILDSHKEPVEEADVKILINKKEYFSTKTSSKGTFQIEIFLSKKTFEEANISLKIEKTAFKTAFYEIKKDEFAKKEKNFYWNKNFILERAITPAFWIATLIFIFTYLLISFELLHRTISAMLGSAFILIITYTLGTLDPAYHILSFEKAIECIDMNVIFLLMGMMIIVGVLKHTGVFQWCAYMSYRLAKGNVMILAIISCFFIAITSAFLDNVTTMLLYTPVLIEISIALKINPFSLLLPGIMASNVGGTATLIGDPPNILIGSYSGLTFMQFVKNLIIPVIISMFFLILYNKFFFSKEYHKGKIENIDEFIAKLREEYKIKDRTLLIYGSLIMSIVIFFFITHGYWHMEACIPALFGGALLFTYSVATKKVNLLELIEKDIEWCTLLFFIFLFILVGAVQEVGLLDLIADWVYKVSHGNLNLAICIIIWVAAIMSAFVDNIPFTATMLPIVGYLTKIIPGAESNVLWWALALGACFGGNGTLIGASANVVTIGIAESIGYKITFFEFMKYAFIYMILTILISNIWLIIAY
ncbi:citrate transporter [Candidatus Pacearchaeota archaeon]|nr:MAG: citrate transporter [Candidatus Pacearchaeota archaeon]